MKAFFLRHFQLQNQCARLPRADESRRNNWPEGLTVLELIIVVAIIGTLTSIAIPSYSTYKEKARVAAAIAEIRIIENEINGYFLDHHDYPQSLMDITSIVFNDLWGNPYQYLKIAGVDHKGKGGDDKRRKDHFLVPVNSDYDLYSKGRDGASNAPFTAKMSRDDIVRANDGQFVGLASEY